MESDWCIMYSVMQGDEEIDLCPTLCREAEVILRSRWEEDERETKKADTVV